MLTGIVLACAGAQLIVALLSLASKGRATSASVYAASAIACLVPVVALLAFLIFRFAGDPVERSDGTPVVDRLVHQIRPRSVVLGLRVENEEQRCRSEIEFLLFGIQALLREVKRHTGQVDGGADPLHFRDGVNDFEPRSLL